MEPSQTGAIAFHWLRRPGDERQLTDCLGHLADADPAIACGMAAALLDAAAEQAPDRAAIDRLLDALSQLPMVRCECEHRTREHVTRERRRLRAEQRREGRIDWVFRDDAEQPTFKLGVEVKIDSTPGEHQLQLYHAELSDPLAPHTGLLLLTRDMPKGAIPLPGTMPLWRGVVLWEQLFPRLREIVPCDPALAAQWPFLIDVLASREDVGVVSPSWEQVLGGPVSELHRVLSRTLPAVQHHAETAIRSRPGREQLSATRWHSSLELRVTGGVSRPVFAFRFRRTDGMLEMVTEIPPRPRWPRRNPRYDTALLRLGSSESEGVRCRRSNGFQERVRLLSPDKGEPLVLILDLVCSELDEVAASGLLDDLRPPPGSLSPLAYSGADDDGDPPLDANRHG